MNKRPTLKTVADHAGVSLPTVSQVLRGVGRIGEDTRRRVLASVKDVGYIHDARAASVRTGRSQEVSIIVHDIGNHFNAEVVDSAARCLEADGYFLSIMDAKGDPERLEHLVRIVLSKSCAGLLWVPSERVDTQLIRLIEKQQIPTVTFLREMKVANFPSLGIANAKAIRTATEYLISLNHKQIAFAGGEGKNQTRSARIQGYQTAINNKGLIFDCADSKQGGFEFATTLIDTLSDISAVVCNGDEFAIGLCLGLSRRNIIPGKDISIIGFDDVKESALHTPALTTMSLKPTVFGEKLAEKLLQQFKGNKIVQSNELILPELIIRETTSKRT